jgi:hypothetical protein
MGVFPHQGLCTVSADDFLVYIVHFCSRYTCYLWPTSTFHLEEPIFDTLFVREEDDVEKSNLSEK